MKYILVFYVVLTLVACSPNPSDIIKELVCAIFF